jgi:hypothetical protein
VETIDIRFTLAQHIRDVDSRNELEPRRLGLVLAGWLYNLGYRLVEEEDMCTLVAEYNPDKTMGAAELADLIVDELGLDD